MSGVSDIAGYDPVPNVAGTDLLILARPPAGVGTSTGYKLPISTLTQAIAAALPAPGGPGAAGVGFASAAINGNGHLILTKTDGSTVDVGLLPTTAGAAGIGISSAAVSGSGHLVLTLTNGATIDAGALPASPAGSGSGSGVAIGTTAGTARDAAAAITAEQAASSTAAAAQNAAATAATAATSAQTTATAASTAAASALSAANNTTTIALLPTTTPTAPMLLVVTDPGTGSSYTITVSLAALQSMLAPGSSSSSSGSSTSSGGSTTSGGQVTSGGTATSYAAYYTSAISAASGQQGTPVQITLTPGNGGWPSVTITPTVSGATGTFSPATSSPTAGSTAAVTFTFTSSTPGTAALSSTTNPGMTNSTGNLTYTVNPVAATSATAPAAPSSSTVGVTITGLTSTLTPSNATAYASLTVAGSEETPRTAITSGTAFGLNPAASGSATIGVYASATGGAALATSSAFSVGAGSGRPTMAMTNPVYDTASPKVGTAALNGGSGSVALTSSGGWYYEAWIRVVSPTGAAPVIDLTDGTNHWGLLVADSQLIIYSPSGISGQHTTVDSNWHFIQLVYGDSVNAVLRIDGGNQASYAAYPTGASLTLSVAANGGYISGAPYGQNPSVAEVDSLSIFSATRTPTSAGPTAPLATNTPNLIASYGFDGNGVSQ